MREIKFRGISVVSNKFVYGSLISLGNGYVIAKSSDIVGTTSSDDVFLSYSNDEVDIVFPDTIGQFTGLHDKNGKEIYEGDIVLHKGYHGERIPMVVRFECGAFIVGYHEGSSTKRRPMLLNSQCEMTGNIFDNKELLED